MFSRLLGFLASSLRHDELEKADGVQVDDPGHWAHAMLRLNTRFGVKVLGGCCGTNRQHLELLAGLKEADALDGVHGGMDHL